MKCCSEKETAAFQIPMNIMDIDKNDFVDHGAKTQNLIKWSYSSSGK